MCTVIDPFSLVEWRHLNCHDQRPTKNPLLRSFPVSDPHQCDHETPRGSYDSNFTPGMTLNIPVRIIPSIKAMSLNFNALDREKKKKEKKREKKKVVGSSIRCGPVSKRCTMNARSGVRRSLNLLLTSNERVDFERVPLHGERAFRKRLYIIFSRPERSTEKKIRSDSERVSKTAKSFTQD